MDGKSEKQVVVCCIGEAHSPLEQGRVPPCSLPLPSLVPPLRSNCSVPSFTEKEGVKKKDEDGSPVQLCMFILSTGVSKSV